MSKKNIFMYMKMDIVLSTKHDFTPKSYYGLEIFKTLKLTD